jgi:glucosamine kinase
MILIADSGSTKTDWRLIANNGQISQNTSKGLNPYFWTDEEMEVEISASLTGWTSDTIQKIYFYGAGLGSEEQRLRVKNVLERVFPNCESVACDHDLLGAARGASGRYPGVVCIIGTGANACLYNGATIDKGAISPGYILGDEGSGSWFGKMLIQAYLRNEMPEAEIEDFKIAFPYSDTEILSRIYSQARPNQFLASFMPFLLERKNEAWAYQFLASGFSQFIEKYVQPLNASPNLPLHFVGGVAWSCQEILTDLLRKEGRITGRFLQSPIAGLSLYHQEELL